MCVAENILPRVILRLLQHLRVNTVLTRMQLTPAAALDKYEKAIDDADRFLKLLHDFSSLGAAMRTVLGWVHQSSLSDFNSDLGRI